MPIILRSEKDMFRLTPIVDLMCNPVNLIGAAGAGLAKVFRDKHPEAYLQYKLGCEKNRLKIGGIQVLEDSTVHYKIVNIPTKRHWADPSDIEDIKKSLDAFRRYLQRPGHQLFTVAMPMLGCGLGQLKFEDVYPLFGEYLGDLDNVIHVCQAPDKISHTPRYIGIVGPQMWANRLNPHTSQEEYDEQYQYVEDGLIQALAYWGIQYDEFDGFVSGGSEGVATVACGVRQADPNHLEFYRDSLAAKYSSRPAIVCPADWKRYGRMAGMIRNRTIVDVVTHLVAILPPKALATDTSMCVRLAYDNNEGKTPDDPHYKHVRVIGRNVFDTPESTLVHL